MFTHWLKLSWPSGLGWWASNQPKSDFLYIKEEFIKNPTNVAKIVIFGHTQTSDIHGSSDVWFGDGKIGIDGGCAYGKQLNCL